MAAWFVKGDTHIGYDMIPERKKPVFGILGGNEFTVYGNFRDERAAKEFMEKMADFFCIERGKEDGK